MERILSSRFLKLCKLWPDSMEFLNFKYRGGITSSQVKVKIAAMERADDRTPCENEYLDALKRTLKEG
jgi:hypothetical protein